MIVKTRQPASSAADEQISVLVGVGKARGIVRGPAQPGGFRHERHAPSPPLAAFVEHYWMVQWNLDGHAPQQRETLPHPSAHLLIERGRSRMAGVSTRRFTRVLEGRGRVFGVKFRPAGFQPFLHASMTTLTDRDCSLAQVFGHNADTLEDELLAHDTMRGMIEVAERFLGARLPPVDAVAARIDAIVYAIIDDREMLRAEQLAARHGMPLRHLQRLFGKYVGVSPKWVIGRYRLHEALARLDAGKPVDWTALALALGYFDHAHFIRDFKQMVGRTPGEYTRALPAGRD